MKFAIMVRKDLKSGLITAHLSIEGAPPVTETLLASISSELCADVPEAFGGFKELLKLATSTYFMRQGYAQPKFAEHKA